MGELPRCPPSPLPRCYTTDVNWLIKMLYIVAIVAIAELLAQLGSFCGNYFVDLIVFCVFCLSAV